MAARSAHVEDQMGLILLGRPADLTIFHADMTLAGTLVGGMLVE